jgi:hypothetical protein
MIGRHTFIINRLQPSSNRNMTDYLDVSRRDIGAGLAAGGSALLGAALVNL